MTHPLLHMFSVWSRILFDAKIMHAYTDSQLGFNFPFFLSPNYDNGVKYVYDITKIKGNGVTLWSISFITRWRSSWMAFIQERRIVIPMEWLYFLVKSPFFWCLILHVYGWGLGNNWHTMLGAINIATVVVLAIALLLSICHIQTAGTSQRNQIEL